MSGPFTLTVPQEDLLELVKSDGSSVLVTPSTGGGGGAVTSVSGTAPVVASPTTGAVVVSIAADAFWPVSTPIDASVTAPELAQAQQTAPNATPPDIIISATDAAAGSNDPGGRVVVMTGFADGTGTPSRFLVVQPTTAAGTPQSKLTTAKTLLQTVWIQGTLVSSVGVGDPSGVGTQLILNSQPTGRNSLVSHGVVQMSALDNATSGQSNWIAWDATNLLPGAFTGTYDVNTGGTANDTGIYLQRRQGTVGQGTGIHSYIVIADGGTGEGDGTKRIAFEEQGSSGSLAFYDSTGAITAQETAWIRAPFGAGGSAQGVLVIRDSVNTTDLEVISLHFGDLFWGNGTLNTRYLAGSQHLFEFNGTAPASAVYRFDNTTGDQPLAILNDGVRSNIQGTSAWPPTKDATRRWQGNANTNTTSAQAILTITPTDNAISTYEVTITSKDSVTGDFANFKHMWSYGKASGTIVAGAGTQPAAVDINHTSAAVGVAPQFAVGGGAGNIVLNVTPWTTNLTHWFVQVVETANVGTF